MVNASCKAARRWRFLNLDWRIVFESRLDTPSITSDARLLRMHMAYDQARGGISTNMQSRLKTPAHHPLGHLPGTPAHHPLRSSLSAIVTVYTGGGHHSNHSRGVSYRSLQHLKTVQLSAHAANVACLRESSCWLYSSPSSAEDAVGGGECRHRCNEATICTRQTRNLVCQIEQPCSVARRTTNNY